MEELNSNLQDGGKPTSSMAACTNCMNYRDPRMKTEGHRLDCLRRRRGANSLRVCIYLPETGTELVGAVGDCGGSRGNLQTFCMYHKRRVWARGLWSTRAVTGL